MDQNNTKAQLSPEDTMGGSGGLLDGRRLATLHFLWAVSRREA